MLLIECIFFKNPLFHSLYFSEPLSCYRWTSTVCIVDSIKTSSTDPPPWAHLKIWRNTRTSAALKAKTWPQSLSLDCTTHWCCGCTVYHLLHWTSCSYKSAQRDPQWFNSMTETKHCVRAHVRTVASQHPLGRAEKRELLCIQPPACMSMVYFRSCYCRVSLWLWFVHIISGKQDPKKHDPRTPSRVTLLSPKNMFRRVTWRTQPRRWFSWRSDFETFRLKQIGFRSRTNLSKSGSTVAVATVSTGPFYSSDVDRSSWKANVRVQMVLFPPAKWQQCAIKMDLSQWLLRGATQGNGPIIFEDMVTESSK